jgi:hypothetical protein
VTRVTKRVEVLIGTKKGAFILESDVARRDWRLRGPFCQNWPTHDFVRAADGTLYAGGGNNWYGPSVWRSLDNGDSWTQSSAGLTYGDDQDRTIWARRINGTLYAGVGQPVFRSDDAGET